MILYLVIPAVVVVVVEEGFFPMNPNES